MTKKFDITYKILQEQFNTYSGNGYKLLASMDIFPGKKYNFIQQIKKWYKENTQLSPEEINTTIQAKIQHALKDKSPYFAKLNNFNEEFLLAGPEDFDELIKHRPEFKTNAWAIYFHALKKLLINPYLQFPSQEILIQTVIHELLHAVQYLPNPADKNDPRNKIQNLYNPDKITFPWDGDVNIIKGIKDKNISLYGLKSYSNPRELDTIFGEINRAIAKIKNVIIYPNDVNTAEKELRYILDPNNETQIPKEFLEGIIILRGIISGEGKATPNTQEEQDRLIKLFAQRMSLLAKNIPKNKQANVV